MNMLHSNVSLRAITLEDAAVLMELNNDKRISEYTVGTPTVVTLEQQEEWIQGLVNEKNVKRWMVHYKGRAVGTVFLSSIDVVNKVGNANIKILPDFQGMGIAKAALVLLCSMAFDELGLCVVTANILSYNVNSQALFQKVGFHVDGILRSRVIKNGNRYDLTTMSLLKEERYCE